MFARIMAAVTLLLIVGTLAAFLAAIWLEDGRWAATGLLGLVAGIIVGGVTGAAFENEGF